MAAVQRHVLPSTTQSDAQLTESTEQLIWYGLHQLRLHHHRRLSREWHSSFSFKTAINICTLFDIKEFCIQSTQFFVCLYDS